MEIVLRSFLPFVQKLYLKDEIYNFRQLYSESMHEAWFRYKKKLIMVSSHLILGKRLIEIIYRAPNSSIRSVEDMISGIAFMHLR